MEIGQIQACGARAMHHFQPEYTTVGSTITWVLRTKVQLLNVDQP